jgi:hypothetical protein
MNDIHLRNDGNVKGEFPGYVCEVTFCGSRSMALIVAPGRCRRAVTTPTTLTKARPTQVTPAQAAAVNAWIAGCELAWIIYPDGDAAEAAERALHHELRPNLSKR